jgi:phosphatidylinositol alpha-mannosyltransferase
VRVGLVCPYSWDVPGGVQSHVRDLARVLRARGYSVGVLAPGERSTDPDEGVETVGRTVPVPYNGSVARLAFGPRVAARTRRWLREGEFDLVHVHEPGTPSLSLLALWASEQPVVATFHTATQRSRAMASVASLVRPSMEKISARIAVSEVARETLVKHVSGEPVVIPNGVDHAALSHAPVQEQWRRPGPTIAFLGRVDEPRKGFAVALDAFSDVRRRRPTARLIVAGPVADPDRVVPHSLRESVHMLGVVSDADRARLLRSSDVFIAPNTYGESFGIVVVEAMAAGAAVVASDLPAFRAILGATETGLLFPVGDAPAAAGLIDSLLADDSARSELGARATLEAKRYDWAQVIVDIEGVYKVVLPPRSRS